MPLCTSVLAAVEAAAAPRRGRAVAHDGADCVAADRTGEQPSELRVAVSAWGTYGVLGVLRGFGALNSGCALSGESGSATVGPCVVPQVDAERMLSLLQVAAVACCRRVASCRCCMLSLLQVVAVACCRCCKLSLLHVLGMQQLRGARREPAGGGPGAGITEHVRPSCRGSYRARRGSK